MHVAVIGCGGVGAAAARFLAADGHRVVVFEQFRLNHDRGSSYGASRIIRRVYPDALYASLMEAAYPLWEALERESGERLFLRCGGLFFGPEGHPEMAATEAALRAVGIPFERWSAAEAARRYPPFRLQPEEYALFEPESGLLDASRCVLAAARSAVARGAEVREGARVEAIEPTPEGIRLRVGEDQLVFDRAVVTAGPWIARLLAPRAALPLEVTRQQYAYFAVREDRHLFAPDRFPVWIDMAALFYGFPEHGEIPGVKTALHRRGAPIDPDSPDRQPSDEENRVLRDYLRRRLPAAAGPVTHAAVCLYTNTPDEDFVIDRLPGEPRVIFASACSGHGFKFAILVGRILADLAQDREPGHDLRRFALSRFATARA